MSRSTSRTEEAWRDNIRGSSGADWKRTAEAMRDLCFKLESELDQATDKGYAHGFIRGRFDAKPKAEDIVAEDIIAEEVTPHADV